MIDAAGVLRILPHQYPMLLVDRVAEFERGRPVPAGRVVLIGSVANVEFRGGVLPGQVIEHRVRLVRAIDHGTVLEGMVPWSATLWCARGRAVMTVRDAVAADVPASGVPHVASASR